MMMAMLEAGGMAVLADSRRKADPDNPRGYYEYEPVKRLPRDRQWLAEARGKAVKMTSFYLCALPAAYRYQVIFMQRPLGEVLASQRQMLQRRDASPDLDDTKMGGLFERHLTHTRDWLGRQTNMNVFYVNHGAALADPARIARQVASFLQRELDVEPMAAAVDPALYRQRAE